MAIVHYKKTVGTKYHSGRHRKWIELSNDNSAKALELINRMLNAWGKLSDEELIQNNKAIDACLKLEIKRQDIEAQREESEVKESVLLSLLDHAMQEVRSISRKDLKVVNAEIIEDEKK